MADDVGFTAVRRNFFMISILLLVLALTKTSLGSFEILGVNINASNDWVYFGIWLGYLYYAWRYLQIFGEKWEDFRKRSYDSFFGKYRLSFEIDAAHWIKQAHIQEFQDLDLSTFKLGQTSMPSQQEHGSRKMTYHWNPSHARTDKIENFKGYVEPECVVDFVTEYEKDYQKHIFGNYILFKQEFFLYIFPLVFSGLMLIVAFFRFNWPGNLIYKHILYPISWGWNHLF